MSAIGSILGTHNQQGTANQQQQIQQGVAGQQQQYQQGYYNRYYQQLQQQDTLGGGFYQVGLVHPEPQISYNPIYPIAITHRGSGRKLIIWED